MDSFQLRVCSDVGTTFYSFPGSRQGSVTSVCFLKQSETAKGKQLIASNSITSGSVITANVALAVCVIGKQNQRVCWGCFRIIKKKVKIRSDCPCVSFCSSECLENSGEFMDVCGVVLKAINDKRQDMKLEQSWADIAVLAVVFLYELSVVYRGDDLIRFRYMLEDSITHDCEREADNVFRSKTGLLLEVILQHAPHLLPPHIGSSSVDIVDRLFRIIQYNSQSLRIAGIENTFLFTLLPTLSKINHSCVPNAMFIFDVVDSAPARVSPSNRNSTPLRRNRVNVSLVAISEIAADSEVSVSYIDALCVSWIARKSLLSQFHFQCDCPRCICEKFLNSPSSLAGNTRFSAAMTVGGQVTSTFPNSFVDQRKVEWISIDEHLNAFVMNGAKHGIINSSTFFTVLQLAVQLCNCTKALAASIGSSRFVAVPSNAHDAAGLILAYCNGELGGTIFESTSSNSALKNTSEVSNCTADDYLLYSAIVSSFVLVECWGMLSQRNLHHYSVCLQKCADFCVRYLAQQQQRGVKKIIDSKWQTLVQPCLDRCFPLLEELGERIQCCFLAHFTENRKVADDNNTIPHWLFYFNMRRSIERIRRELSRLR
jgi:hypothetical protein